MITREEKAEQIEKEWKKEENKEKQHIIIKKTFKLLFILIILLVILLTYMNLVGTKGLIVKEYKISSTNLPESFHGFKIVHFSDLHYGTTVHEKELNNLVTKINELKPDLVVFTGDLLDKNKNITVDEINLITKALKKITVTTSKYAIKGEEDYNKNYEKILKDSDFIIIDNNYELIYYKGNTPIMLTGTGSSIKNDYDIDKAFSYDKQDNLYTISLIHEPDIIETITSKYKANLILAGHTHNGQIRIPFIGSMLKKEDGKKYINSHYQINNTEVYISGGIGTSNYEFRFFNHPSINFYRLTKEAK